MIALTIYAIWAAVWGSLAFWAWRRDRRRVPPFVRRCRGVRLWTRKGATWEY